MAVYFDTGTRFWDPGPLWRALAPAQWDTWFLPGVGDGPQGEGTAKAREFVLQVQMSFFCLWVWRGSVGLGEGLSLCCW